MIAHLLASRSGEVISVVRGTRVSDVIALLADRRIGAVPVLDNGSVIGIMSERDVIYRLRSDGAAVLDLPVEQVMTAPVHTVDSDSSLLGCVGSHDPPAYSASPGGRQRADGRLHLDRRSR